MRLLKKLRARRGESLTETLCAVLVAGLAVSLLAGMVGAATRIASKANTAAKSLYEAVSNAEARTTASGSTVTGKVTVTVNENASSAQAVEVTYYGDADEVQSYAETDTGGSGS